MWTKDTTKYYRCILTQPGSALTVHIHRILAGVSEVPCLGIEQKAVRTDDLFSHSILTLDVRVTPRRARKPAIFLRTWQATSTSLAQHCNQKCLFPPIKMTREIIFYLVWDFLTNLGFRVLKLKNKRISSQINEVWFHMPQHIFKMFMERKTSSLNSQEISHPVIKRNNLLPCSKEHATELYPERDISTPHRHLIENNACN